MCIRDSHSGDDFEDLTPYVYYAGKAAQEVFGKQLFKGFTPGETEQYKVLFDKMCENAAEGLAETERMN